MLTVSCSLLPAIESLLSSLPITNHPESTPLLVPQRVYGVAESRPDRLVAYR